MPPRSAPHPSPDTLLAYDRGQLDEFAAASVKEHLDRCPVCRQELVRAARPASPASLASLRPDNRAVPLPSSAHAATPPPHDSDPAGPVDVTLPRELRDHPHYKVVRELGRGGMGVVYLATQTLMQRKEVLKVMNPALLGRPGARDRFLREIRSAAQLSHPHVALAFGALAVGELLVFAMEYVEGEDLGKLVKARGPLALAAACTYARQVAEGLQHAHERGMVHRDIKPSNLVLTRLGKKHAVKILDFGLAKATREGGTANDLTDTGQMLGTPDYVAPEQILDAARADIRADIYSLGCTLYFLLSGTPPFKGNNVYEVLHGHQARSATPLNEVRPEVPKALAAIVARMMKKDPADRYQEPAEVAQALAALFKTPGEEPVRSSKRPASGEKEATPPAPPRKTSRTFVLGLLLCGVAAVALWLAGYTTGSDRALTDLFSLGSSDTRDAFQPWTLWAADFEDWIPVYVTEERVRTVQVDDKHVQEKYMVVVTKLEKRRCRLLLEIVRRSGSSFLARLGPEGSMVVGGTIRRGEIVFPERDSYAFWLGELPRGDVRGAIEGETVTLRWPGPLLPKASGPMPSQDVKLRLVPDGKPPPDDPKTPLRPGHGSTMFPAMPAPAPFAPKAGPDDGNGPPKKNEPDKT